MAKSRKKGKIIMNTITSSSKSAVRFTLNFFEKTITGTKASFNKANKGYGPEYEELTAKMAAHPDFTLEVKEQKSKATKAKKTYEGMDTKFIKDFIATLTNAKEVMAEYEAIQKMAKDCDTLWFASGLWHSSPSSARILCSTSTIPPSWLADSLSLKKKLRLPPRWQPDRRWL